MTQPIYSTAIPHRHNLTCNTTTPTRTAENIDEIKADDILTGQYGIDTVQLICSRETAHKIITQMGYIATPAPKNSPLNPYIASIGNQLNYDPKRRYKEATHALNIEQVKLTNGRELSNYMIIIQNTPELFDYAIEKKKAKDYYCMVVFTGLHQPSKHISSEAVKVISRFLKRKGFKTHRVDIAADFNSTDEVSYRGKAAFVERTKGYNSGHAIAKGSTLYCNETTHADISRYMVYDKYQKQKAHHRQKLGDSLKGWRRFEATLRPPQPGKQSFIEYIQTQAFIDALMAAHDIGRRFGAFDGTSVYLEYQINALIDNRVLNNRASRERFNSPASVERFQTSDFRRYQLP